MLNVASAHSTTLAEASGSKRAKSMNNCVSCLACKVRKHPLYSCSKFKALPYGQRAAMAIKNELCITSSNEVISGRSVCLLIDAWCVKSYTALCCIVRLTLILRPKQAQLMKAAIRRMCCYDMPG